jgi:hypothetical protein
MGLEWLVEAVSTAGRTGKRRLIARAGKMKRPASGVLAPVRAPLREIGEADVAQIPFCCAPAKRIRISRLEHIFDL